MNFDSAPAPQPDPLLQAQETQAQTAQQSAVQAGLSSDTLNILRLFGQQNAMSGAGLTSPMTSMVGSRAIAAAAGTGSK